eukprot:TRINITY_DN1482_c0_g1_i12.p1 TRINITY_DN1482_c0_g1~~TRINITY_DN1482_c0_g1_i12.p1  ORF type:complete len:309 (-),score=102.21 TRINITY_DN1482_c0_g1_i12:53-979(-)
MKGTNILRAIWVTPKDKAQSFFKFRLVKSEALPEEAEEAQKVEELGTTSSARFIVIPAAVLVMLGILYKMRTKEETKEERKEKPEDPIVERRAPARPKELAEENKGPEKSKRAKKLERRHKSSMQQNDSESEEEALEPERSKTYQYVIEEYIDFFRKKPKRVRRYKKRRMINKDTGDEKEITEVVFEEPAEDLPKLETVADPANNSEQVKNSLETEQVEDSRVEKKAGKKKRNRKKGKGAEAREVSKQPEEEPVKVEHVEAEKANNGLNDSNAKEQEAKENHESEDQEIKYKNEPNICLLYTSPSPRD